MSRIVRVLQTCTLGGALALSSIVSTTVVTAQPPKGEARDDGDRRDGDRRDGPRRDGDRGPRDREGDRGGRGFGRPQGGPPIEIMMRAFPVLKALDADKDGEISAAEIENATVALKKIDKNGDGKLTEEELRPTFGGRPGFGPPEGRGPGGPRGPGGDRSRSGRPDMERRGPPPRPADGAGPARDGQPRRGVSPELLSRMFQNRDQNQDGKLSGDEIPEQMRARLGQVDRDGDGSVSRKELDAMMQRMRSGGGRPGARDRDGGEGGQRAGGDVPRRPKAE